MDWSLNRKTADQNGSEMHVTWRDPKLPIRGWPSNYSQSWIKWDYTDRMRNRGQTVAAPRMRRLFAQKAFTLRCHEHGMELQRGECEQPPNKVVISRPVLAGLGFEKWRRNQIMVTVLRLGGSTWICKGYTCILEQKGRTVMGTVLVTYSWVSFRDT